MNLYLPEKVNYISTVELKLIQIIYTQHLSYERINIINIAFVNNAQKTTVNFYTKNFDILWNFSFKRDTITLNFKLQRKCIQI